MKKTKKTKAQAQKEVQALLDQAMGLLAEAGKVMRPRAKACATKDMDRHKFTVQFMGLDYMVRHKYEHEEAADGNNPFGFYFEINDDADYDKYYAGSWMPSSQWRGC